MLMHRLYSLHPRNPRKLYKQINIIDNNSITISIQRRSVTVMTTTTTTTSTSRDDPGSKSINNPSLLKYYQQHPQKRFLTSPLSQTTPRPRSLSTTNKSPFPRWPVPMIESRGDYRHESSTLEPLFHNQPLYAAQSTLPRLPVPDPQSTIETFLPTALPLAETEEEMKNLMQRCKAFPKEAGELQRLLLQRKNGEMKDSSWLQLWWNTTGYLQVRDSIVINVSYFFHLSNDPSLADTTTSTDTSSTKVNIKRGASFLHSSTIFRKQLCSGSYPHQTIGKKHKTPLCSVAFKYMFHACRVPHRHMDGYRIYDPSLIDYRHCIVARKGRYYKVNIVKPDGSGDPVHVKLIEKRLEKCIEMADEDEKRQRQNGNVRPMLGWLTSSDRDSWADAREEILRVGGTEAKRALETLESGTLMLCLDDEAPVSKKECAELFLTGNYTSGHNRWFDKSIQLFVTNNGKGGLQGEHSMMDGMPVIELSEFITKRTYADAIKDSSELAEDCDGEGETVEEGVEDIFAKCSESLVGGDSSLNAMIEKAKSDYIALTSANELDIQSFHGYGSNYIKKAGHSPDAYAQMAIQLASYRLHGKQVGTYEATQMRPFLHGRTETTRTVSLESATFVKRMGMVAKFDDDAAAMAEKRDLLSKATRSHVEYIGKAAQGKAVDRHFTGLAMTAAENPHISLPSLYSDPVFTRSKTWRNSTSHLTHPTIENWGFGQVVPDGLGVGYSVKPDCCMFNVAAKREHGWTQKFCDLLEEALLEMRALSDARADVSHQSKL